MDESIMLNYLQMRAGHRGPWVVSGKVKRSLVHLQVVVIGLVHGACAQS